MTNRELLEAIVIKLDHIDQRLDKVEQRLDTLEQRFDSLTALNIAVLSAQLVAPKEEFSILQPINTCPSVLKSAAPTAKCEYGEYEFSSASLALATSSLSVIYVTS